MLSSPLSPALARVLIGIYRFSCQHGVTPGVRDLAATLSKGQGPMWKDLGLP